MRICASSTGHRSPVILKAGFPSYPENNENVIAQSIPPYQTYFDERFASQ